jgi:hypothetical protein
VVLTNNYNGQSSLGGVLLPVGTTIVVWTATDANGNTDACTIEIEVEDTQFPFFITCPPTDITLSLAPGGCETVLTWAIPVAEDNCGIADIEQTGGPLFGATVGVGVYDIEYTAFDLYGNEAVCEFTITVEDTQGPILACPVDVTLGTDAGECTYESVAGQFNPILSVDNCPNVILERSLDGGMNWTLGSVPAGTVFVLGTTTITYRLVDENGNVSEECDFTVTVIDDEAPVIECPVALTGEVDASCVYVFSPNLVEANVTDNCDVYGGLTIDYRVFGPDNSVSGYIENGDPFNFVVGISQIEWRVVDGAGNVATCLQAMTVSDATPPVITCPTIDPSYDNTFDLCGYIAQGTEFDATATDNCSGVVLTNNYNGQSSLGGLLLPVGTTIVVWTATDANGNTDECTIEIEVEDTQFPFFITCPPTDITLSLAPGGCETVLTWAIPVAEDNCGIADIEQTGGPLFGATVGVGVYDIEYTAFDLYGNEAVCEFTITVEDTQGPILACPVDVTLGTDAGECTYESVAGQFNPILSVDNCPNVILERSLYGR